MKRLLPVVIGICCLLIGSTAMTTSNSSAATPAVDNLSPELRRELARARNTGRLVA